MEPLNPATEAAPFIPYVDFTRPIYLHETKDLVVTEHLRMFTIHLDTSKKVQNWPYWSAKDEGQVEYWLTVYPSLKWVNASTDIYYDLPNSPEIGRPAHFVLFLPQEDYSTPQKFKWSPLMRTGGYCEVTGLSEKGITCLYGDTEIYIPARPTDSQLKNKFIQTLRAYITDQLRDEFIKYHFHSYTVNPRAFVDYIRSIVVDEDLFSTGDREPIREYLLQWVQRQRARFQEFDSLRGQEKPGIPPSGIPVKNPTATFWMLVHFFKTGSLNKPRGFLDNAQFHRHLVELYELDKTKRDAENSVKKALQQAQKITSSVRLTESERGPAIKTLQAVQKYFETNDCPERAEKVGSFLGQPKFS